MFPAATLLAESPKETETQMNMFTRGPFKSHAQGKTAQYCLQASLPAALKQCPTNPSRAAVTTLLKGDTK